MFDAARVQRETGWVVDHREVVGSTNDEAARLRDAGAGPRVVVIADRQERGRGRGARAFASPAGGLYASMLVAAATEDLPGPLTAAFAVAAARAIEAACGVACGIKWPNDLWVERRKAGGLLLEAAGPDRLVVAGLGVNLREVPEALPAAVRAETTALDAEAGRRVERTVLLEALLPLVDACTADLRGPDRRAELERAWRERLLFIGERVTYRLGERRCAGTLRDASLGRGLRIDDDEDGPVHRRSEHVHDLRPA